MAKREDLEAKRAQVRASHRNATRKISRLNRQNGVELANTKYDPRGDLGKIKSYTGKQLDSQLARLDKFNSRDTQFVMFADRTIDEAGPGSLWATYKRDEITYNNRVNKNYKKVEDVHTAHAYDGKGRLVDKTQTIGKRMGTVTADNKRSRPARVNAVYQPPQRRAAAIKDRKALQILANDMRARVTTDVQEKQLRLGQANFGKMNNVIKDPELEAMINDLSPKQFSVLWNLTSFSDDVALNYIQAKKALEAKQDGKKLADDDEDFESALQNAKDHAKWAKKLDFDKIEAAYQEKLAKQRGRKR